MNAKFCMAVGLGIAGLLMGCAYPQGTATVGVPFNTQLVGYIQPEFSTQREVVNWFGSPLARTTVADDEGVTDSRSRYSYLHGASTPEGENAAYLEVEFDPDGLVTDFYFTESGNSPSED